MIFDSFPEFLPAGYRVKFATEPGERRQAAPLRRKVFCEEQRVFAHDDRDAIDEFAIRLVAISSLWVAPDDVGVSRMGRSAEQRPVEHRSKS